MNNFGLKYKINTTIIDLLNNHFKQTGKMY